MTNVCIAMRILYDEYFLVVDTAHPEHRVLVWTGESAFEELCSSFDAFYASLADTCRRRVR